MYFWAVVLECFKTEKMRETVIVLKIQIMLKYRMVHSSFSVACLIFSGVFALPKSMEQSPFVAGEEHVSLFLHSRNFKCNYNEKEMVWFLTFLTHLVLCFQMPFNQVACYFSIAESRSIFHIVAFHVCNFFSLKGNFNFLYWSRRVPLIMGIHSSGKIINGLITVVLQSATQVLFCLNLFT